MARNPAHWSRRHLGIKNSSLEDIPITSVADDRKSDRPTLSRILALGVVLFALWLVLSGIYEPLLITFGIISVLIVLAIAIRMDVVDHEGFPVQLSYRLLMYVPWLLREIGKANLDVTKIILARDLKISPKLATFNASQRTDLGRFIYGNSITLTPGTITVGVYGNEFEIHALTHDAFTGTEEGEMDRRIAQLEGTN